MKKIHIIRAYDKQIKTKKGYKILVDRLWPRGVKKEDLPYEWWIKELAPKKETRNHFQHKKERYETFKQTYIEELEENSLSTPFIRYIKEILKTEEIWLIYGAKNEKYNQAVVLKEWIENH